MIAKLRTVVTRRVLKLIEDESKKDPEKYSVWYNEFSNFLKEGIMTDHENRDQLLRLMRYYSTFDAQVEKGKDQPYVSLDDYVKNMKQG